jgi:uncharacterized membrane protein
MRRVSREEMQRREIAAQQRQILGVLLLVVALGAVNVVAACAASKDPEATPFGLAMALVAALLTIVGFFCLFGHCRCHRV